MNISFSMTTEQVRNQTKTVTRRLGWKWLRPGAILQPIEKGQGLKKGEKVKRIGGPIRVTKVSRERICVLMIEGRAKAKQELAAEGFPHMSARQFVAFFCKGHRCDAMTKVTRIEFEYL